MGFNPGFHKKKGEITRKVDTFSIKAYIDYMLAKSQLTFVADVLVTIGEVALVALVIPYFTSSRFDPTFFISGLVTAAAVWIIGLIITRDI